MHARDKHLQAMLENKHHRTAMGVVSIGCEFGRVGWSRKTALERSGGPFSMKGKQAPRGGTRNRRRPREVSRARGAECISYAYAGAKKVRVTATKLTLREGQGRLRRVSLRGGEGGRRPSFRGSGGWPQGEGSERRESALYRRWKGGVSDILLSLPGEGKEDVSLPSCLYSWSSP